MNQPPAIISATDVNFTIGVPNTFTFVTTGFPQLPANGQPGMSLSYSGTLPGGVTFAEVKPVGLSTGVFALSGTPAALLIGPFSRWICTAPGRIAVVGSSRGIGILLSGRPRSNM